MANALALIMQAMFSDNEGEDLLSDAVPLASSAINEVSFEDDTLTLRFEESGSVYEFYGVPQWKARYLTERTPSAGRYFNKSIRNIYPYSRVE